MAYDEQLAERLSKLTTKRHDIQARKMFGGVGFLMRGNMCFGIWKDHLILRLGEKKADKALTQKNVVPFDITGRAMKGWVMIAPKGMKSEDSLKRWVKQSMNFVSKLPRK